MRVLVISTSYSIYIIPFHSLKHLCFVFCLNRMYFKQLLIHLIILVICINAVVCLKKDEFYCEKSSPCTCVSVNNDYIDLSGMNLTLNITTNVTLNYQPCPSDEISPNVVAIKFVNTTSNITTPLAKYMDVDFKINDAVMLVYKNNTNEFDVILSCDPLAKSGKEYLTGFQNDAANYYKIVLKTNQVCGLNLRDAFENNSSEYWTFFFSFLMVVAFIYFVGGSVVNACLFNEMGINMIPHHAFWSSLYNNIKEKLCGTSMMASAYESI